MPRHVAIIMDGNGRWARARGRPRMDGHREGARAVRRVVTRCRELGVRYLTLYAFSVENWKRAADEVGALMDLLGEYLVEEAATLVERAIELRCIGEVDRLPALVRALVEAVCARTAGSGGMRLTLAVSYGGRQEICAAAARLAREARDGELAPEAITPEAFEARLSTAGTPDPDLIIRTSGEQRLSNFLLWQAAYSELYFTPTLWPDFAEEELERAFEEYRRRERRFGRV